MRRRSVVLFVPPGTCLVSWALTGLSMFQATKEKDNDQSNETHVRAAATYHLQDHQEPPKSSNPPKTTGSISVIEPKHSRDSRDYLFRPAGGA